MMCALMNFRQPNACCLPKLQLGWLQLFSSHLMLSNGQWRHWCWVRFGTAFFTKCNHRKKGGKNRQKLVCHVKTARKASNLSAVMVNTVFLPLCNRYPDTTRNTACNCFYISHSCSPWWGKILQWGSDNANSLGLDDTHTDCFWVPINLYTAIIQIN